MKALALLLRLIKRLNILQQRRSLSKEHSALDKPRELEENSAPVIIIDDKEDAEVALTLQMIERVKAILKKEESEEDKPLRKTRSDKGKKRNSLTQLPPLEERVKTVGELFTNLGKKSKSEMICFIMYDISHNKVRTKVAEYLEAKGCFRIQKSIFLGQLERRSYRDIQDALHTIQQSYENDDSIIMVPVSEDEIRSMRMIGKEIDMAFVMGRANTIFI
ncbi:MAG: CRISPR-associated endonuclease Cas2 [Bacteroidota bacterium]